jgi:hypothetical protein
VSASGDLKPWREMTLLSGAKQPCRSAEIRVLYRKALLPNRNANVVLCYAH